MPHFSPGLRISVYSGGVDGVLIGTRELTLKDHIRLMNMPGPDARLQTITESWQLYVDQRRVPKRWKRKVEAA